jgi:autotransporter-associated beta strand protein
VWDGWHRRPWRICLIAPKVFLAGSLVPVHGQTWLYTGTNYGTGANWSTGVVPGAGQTATFASSGANQPIIAGTFTIGTVDMTAGSLTINATRTLNVQSAYNLSDASILGTGTLAMGAGSTLTVAGTTAATIAPVVSGSGAVAVTAPSLTFSGANTYTGATTIGAGSQLNIGAGGATGALGTGATTNDGSLVVNRTGTLSIASAIGGSGTLTQSGTSTTSLTGANTYSGTTTISAGILSVGAGTAAGTLGSGNVVNNATLQINRSDSITIANDISGTGALTKTTAGTNTILTLTGTNSYSGTTTINEGTLRIGAGGTSGSLGSGNVVTSGTVAFNRSDDISVANGISGTGGITQLAAGTTTLTGSNTYTGTTTVSAGTLQVGAGGTAGSLGTGAVTNNATLAFNRSDDIAVANVISGTGALNKVGTNTLTLTGANTYSGTTSIAAGGTLQVGAGGATGALGTGATTNDGSLVVNRTGALTVASAIGGSGTLTHTGSGTTSLTGANTYSGTTTISAGTLQVGSGGTTGSLGSGAVTNNAALAFSRSDAVTVANAISGTGTLTKLGTNTVILTADSTYTGGTTISSGTLQIGNGGTTGSIAGNVVNNGAFSFNRSDSVTLAGDISGSGSFVQAGSGTTTLSGTNSYSGTTTIQSGTLRLGSATALSSASNLALNGGTFDLNGFNATVANLSGVSNILLGAGTLTADQSSAATFSGQIAGTGRFAKGGTGTLVLSGANTYSGGTTISSGMLQIGNGGTTGSIVGNVVNNGSLAFNRSDNVSFAGNISGSGGLVQAGSGMTTLTGNNTYSGTTFINAGILQLGSATALSAATSVVLNGGTLDLNGFGATIGSLSGSSNLALTGGTLTVDQTTNATYAGQITGTGGLVKSGPATLVLTGTSSYTGGTTITSGTLQIGNGGTTGSIVGNVVNNGSLVFNRSDDVTFTGVVSGTGTLIQAGSGTTSLTGTSTYTGGTTVSNGRLAVNGSITSNVTIDAGGILGGTGLIAGSVANSGIVAPGNSIGTLNVQGSFVHGATATYQVEVNAAGQSDRINVTGPGGTATLNGGTVQVIAASGSYSPRTIYTILSTTGGVSGAFSSVTNSLAFVQPELSYDANNVYLALSSNFSLGSQTPNQYAVASALDRGATTATGDFNTVLAALVNLDTAQGPAALDAISGQNYAAFGTANLASGSLFMNALNQQMRRAATGSGAGTRLAFGPACAIGCNEATPGAFSAWTNAMGGMGTATGNGNAATIGYNSGGVAGGIDYRYDETFLIGLGAGYATGSQWLDGFSGRSTSSNYFIAAYSSLTIADAYLNASAGYAFNDNQMTRSIVIPGLSPRTALGRTGADQFLGFVEAGYRIGFGAAASLTPFGQFQVSTVSQAAFNESGANSLSLNIRQQTTQSARSIVGAELAASLPIGLDQGTRLQMRLGWAHEFADLSRPVTASFTGAPTSDFTVFGATTARDQAILSLELSTATVGGPGMFARYDGQIGATSSNHGFLAGVRYSW